ncbi:uncharacterized protein OCT59_007220 [Rhizophagus irregularis]|uniref:uncharacterized protein n=1 Tax=Rhizophagus irregularis TaxID=588596 RepID=UPI0019E75FA3|nr:hypothetical protein OCT59_007220 [Rhizophagus irregularis]GBC32936.2 hypothetical protein GLOIN_2v1769062 [Rhizophagus irregularis DAOM 181602=DAOM 197198]
MTTKRKSPNKSSDDNQEMEVEGGSKRKQITKKRRDIDIEKANQLMKKSKNHSNKEAAESADKEVIVVNEKRSNDDDDDDDEDDDDDDDDDASKTEDHKKPEVFQSKSNLEIVAWLVDHPEILRLALEMNNTDVAISSSSKITDDESVKCLFLRARSPRGEVFDELITKIFKIKIHSNEAKSYLKKTRKFFIDFRNKFNQIILTSVEEFKEIRKNRASTGSLSQKELIDYVDKEFVQKILSQQLVAVNISELTRNEEFDILVDFVRETFKVSWNGKNLSAVKELDNITKELTIPSRSGNKIVDSLSL